MTKWNDLSNYLFHPLNEFQQFTNQKKETWVLNYTLRYNRLLSHNWIYIRMWFHKFILHYHLEVQANPKNLTKNDAIFRIYGKTQPQNSTSDRHLTSTTLKGQSENLKQMSWNNPVFPIDAKNSISFLVQFFWGVSLDF